MNQSFKFSLTFTVMDNAAFGQSTNPALALALYLHHSENRSARDVLAHILDDDLFCIRVGGNEYTVNRHDLREALNDNDDLPIPQNAV